MLIQRQRVLFVDDEPLALQALRRMLYPLRGEWDMAFAESGARALELMAQDPFDVVITDMRMPGMNGAELLNEVMQRYPGTVRLILSGQADKDLILKCVGTTHQYLAKPCEAEVLKAVIRRASRMETSLQSETLRGLTAQMKRLPSLPTLYAEMVEKLRSPEVPLEEVAALIAQDIGMTAQILKLVNSAFFGVQRQIADPQEAVAYLGVDTIKSLVLSVQAFAQLDTKTVTGFSPEALWLHSLQTATAAKAIACAEHADHDVVETSFGAGLLHDTGKLVLACNFGPQYVQALALAETQACPLWVAEKQVFAATHAEVGGYLLGLWGLPMPLVEAIAWHHDPAQSDAPGFSPLVAVHAANALAHDHDQAGSNGTPYGGLDLAFLASRGLAGRWADWRLAAASPTRERSRP